MRVVRVGIHQHADATHALGRLCARGERPRRRAAEQRDELSAVDHSITSAARARSVSGTASPRAFAVLRLMTNSYFVGACTGRSAGLAPLSILSMYVAARRNVSSESAK